MSTDGITYKRENGENIFEFEVRDPEYAFAAISTVPGLYVTGLNYKIGLSEQNTTSSYRWDSYFEVFLCTGFPRSDNPEAFVPRLLDGTPGTVGAKYGYSFPTDGSGKGRMTVETTLEELVIQPDFKEVVYVHANVGSDLPKLGCSAFESPELPANQTRTRFQVCRNDDGKWTVKVCHLGPSAIDPRELEGSRNFYVLWSIAVPLIPCCWPFFPCIFLGMFLTPNPEVWKQMKDVKKYCNGSAEIIAPGGRLDDNSQIQEAIPVSIEEDSSRSNMERAAELKKWYDLYKSGAITQKEYEAEKMKLLPRE